LRGQFSLPLKITVLPHASGTQMARTPRMMGAFQGAMPSTTPAGWRTPMASEPGTSDGMTSPATCVVSDAASRIMLAASMVLKPAHMPVAPVSAATASMNFGSLASSASAAFSSSARRSLGPVLAPGLEGLGGGFHRHHGVGRRSGGRARGHAAVERVAALEGGALFGCDFQAVDEHGQIGHGVLLESVSHSRSS
jgi:hypothetical protein